MRKARQSVIGQQPILFSHQLLRILLDKENFIRIILQLKKIL
jgi:hypothetical protein